MAFCVNNGVAGVVHLDRDVSLNQFYVMLERIETSDESSSDFPALLCHSRDIERAIIDEVVRLVDYNKTLAAKHLGQTRFALDRRLKRGDSE